MSKDYIESSGLYPFIDYDVDGIWLLGLMEPTLPPKDRIISRIDTDEVLEALLYRAFNDWERESRNLWLSPCAREIMQLVQSGMQV